MIRTIDWSCEDCGTYIADALAGEDETKPCPTCGLPMDQVWWKTRQRPGQWGDKDAVLLHVTNDPTVPEDVRIRYVGSHDAKLKPGYERVYLRDLQAVNKFEREHGVANHVMHYDRNGRGLDDDFRGRRMAH